MTRMRLARQGRTVRWLPVSESPALDVPPAVEVPASSLPDLPDLPDPADMTVAAALAWMVEHPDLAEALKALEADGKARKTILAA